MKKTMIYAVGVVAVLLFCIINIYDSEENIKPTTTANAEENTDSLEIKNNDEQSYIEQDTETVHNNINRTEKVI